ncbi:EAL domain-containing protein [Comamonas aquatica]|uniref:putative bifunctional diguanylate cyclase/phosphodiesterase n=1 Tax=Comamonas aquatica TaxID=225991 RepID=UPI0028D80E9B|nr:EAL domain-containing protein [Comamonas aquatica]
MQQRLRKNDLATLELVERGMAAIPLAEREALEKKWKGRPVHRLSYSQLVQYGLLGIAALGGVLALWIWLLRVAVKKKTTEIQAQASQLGLERSRLQEILDATRAGIWEWNVQTGACVFNERWAQMLGYTLEEIRPWTVDTWTRLTHPDDLAPTMERLELHFARKTQYYESEMRMRHKDGHWVWVSDRGRLISRTPEGLPLVMNGTHIDITESKIANDAIWQQANYDSLTQLPNRLLLNDRLTDVLKRAERSQNKVALIFIDLDHFKEVNDTLGHPVGDQLIIQAGARIRRSVRESDTVARLGGDEFCILIADLADVTHLTELAQKVLDQLASPYTLGDEQVYSTASLGISIYPDDAGDAIEMLRHSDQAMYAAKNEGRHCFRFFTASMQESALQRMQLVRDLRQAMALNQFKDYYQPIVELATGRIHKAEALLRWRHPTHGFISPAVFIPIAEDIGAIVEIGGWIFLRAAQNAKKWLSIVGDDLAISINKSPVQFRDRSPEHLDWVRLLETLELPGKHIVAEITEGLLLRQEPFIEEKLLAFRDAGIQVAIDDFGTGYSSLSYLTKFDIDYLKIDKSFTSNLAPGNETQALCEAIIMMAHKVGLKVIAEGVETEQQRDLLKEMGCDYAQGYLYSRPIPAHEFQAMLEAHYRSLNSAVQE